jgi:hypothetical protein
MTEGATSTLKYLIRAENYLNTSAGANVEATFKLLRPAPTNMDAIPLFEWVSDGINNIKLTLRRSNGGLIPSTSPNSTGSTICPVTSVSATGANLTNKIQATTDQLYWQVKASSSLYGNGVGIQTSWADYASNGWSNSDWVMDNIGTMTEDTTYEIFFRLTNRYVVDYKESTSPKIKLTKPNAPTNLTCVLDIVDDNAGTDNTMTFTWVRPTEPGLHYQHDGAADNAALTADPDTPYIQKYEIAFGAPGYAYRFFVTGGSASVRAPQTFTVTGSIATSNGAGTFYVLPDIVYGQFQIKAYNIRLPDSDGPYSTAVQPTYVTSGRTRATANIGVPYTIADVDGTLDTSFQPVFTLGGDYTYGTQALKASDGTQATTGTVKNWNTVNGVSTTIGPVLLNRYRNKPGATDTLSVFYISSNNGDSYLASDIKSNTGTGSINTANNWAFVTLGSAVTDVFPTTYNNKEQWYKTSTLKYSIYVNNIKSSMSGSAKTISLMAAYKTNNNNNTSYVNTAISANQHFDEINSSPTFSGTPTISYTPYYVTGIPTLYPGKTQSITPSYVVDNKSVYYISPNYITKMQLLESNWSGFAGTLYRGFSNFTHSSNLWTAKTTSTEQITGSNIVPTSTSGSIQSDKVKLIVRTQNIHGDGSAHEYRVSGSTYRYFIYDKNTYDLIDNQWPLNKVHLTFPDQAAAHQGTSSSFTTTYRRITLLQPPTSVFNPSTEVSNSHISLSSSNYFNNSGASSPTGTLCEWNYGIFNGTTSPSATRNCLALYNGKFHSPYSLRDDGVGLSSDTGNYPELVTLYNYYVTDSTAANKYLGNPAAHYADNYHWAFYKFVAQNSDNSAVTPVESQIFLADGNDNNNTNIDYSDLLSTEGTTSVSSSPKVKVCIKSFFANNGTTWKISGWNQIVNGPTASNPAAPTQSELNGDLTIPASGTKTTNDWTDSIGKKKTADYDELGNSGAVPTDSTWKTNCRPLPFKHGTSKMNKQVKIWHIIAVGIRNDVKRYIGNVYISRKYDDSL